MPLSHVYFLIVFVTHWTPTGAVTVSGTVPYLPTVKIDTMASFIIGATSHIEIKLGQLHQVGHVWWHYESAATGMLALVQAGAIQHPAA